MYGEGRNWVSIRDLLANKLDWRWPQRWEGFASVRKWPRMGGRHPGSTEKSAQSLLVRSHCRGPHGWHTWRGSGKCCWVSQMQLASGRSGILRKRWRSKKDELPFKKKRIRENPSPKVAHNKPLRLLLESDFEKRFPTREKAFRLPFSSGGFSCSQLWSVDSFSTPEETGWVSPWENAN